MSEDDPSPPAAAAILDRVGFDPAESVLTTRQAEVLVLRKRGLAQAAIADRLGTSRANVANVEASARDNVAKAEATVRFVAAIDAPVQVSIPAETDIYDVPEAVYDACNAEDIKVSYSAPELQRRVLEEAGDVIAGRSIQAPLLVSVTLEGDVQIRRDPSPGEEGLVTSPEGRD